MRNLVVVLALLAACSPAPAEVALLRAGALHYSARSAAGAPLLTGQLDITYSDDSTITGTWSIGWAPGADTTIQVGAQIGTGQLTGTRVGDSLRIQLNPTYADNNVELRAGTTDQGFAGDWEWSSIVGPQTRGSFAATRQ